MGEIPHVHEIGRYAPFFGRVPEFEVDRPAWVVTFKGELPQPMTNEVMIDPTCVSIDGDGLLYATGPVRLASGKMHYPPTVTNPPTLALPPLEP